MSNIIDLQQAKTTVPLIVNGKLPPLRKTNAELRSREHLILDEVKRLQLVARAGKLAKLDISIYPYILRLSTSCYLVSRGIGIIFKVD